MAMVGRDLKDHETPTPWELAVSVLGWKSEWFWDVLVPVVREESERHKAELGYGEGILCCTSCRPDVMTLEVLCSPKATFSISW